MTATPLIHPVCRQQKQHMLSLYGLGICCIHDYSRDKQVKPRSYTLPVDELVKVS